LDNKVITVKVGVEGVEFAVHEGAIRQSSKFFDNALKGLWRESQTRCISLASVKPLHFKIYYQWVLTGQLHSRQEQDSAVLVELTLLPFLAGLGHYLMDASFIDIVSDALLQTVAESRAARTLLLHLGASFYILSPAGSTTRSVVADLSAWYSTFDDIKNMKARFDKGVDRSDFIMDLLHAMAAKFLGPRAGHSPLEGWKTSCKYHSHGDKKPCYREKLKGYVYHLI
jgi:hypothetical protein